MTTSDTLAAPALLVCGSRNSWLVRQTECRQAGIVVATTGEASWLSSGQADPQNQRSERSAAHILAAGSPPAIKSPQRSQPGCGGLAAERKTP